MSAYLPRTLERAILQASERFKVVLVTGMRQVGKSTMLERLDGNRRTVTLDNRIPLELAASAREVFFRQYPPPVLIDEIQRVPDLCLEIKALVDARGRPGLVWLTGSQRLERMRQIPESLAGRVAAFELLPLSLYELQGRGAEQRPWLPPDGLSRGTLGRMTNDELWRMLWQGSWPDVRNDTPENRDLFFEGLLRTYIERDIVRTGVSKLLEFERFLRVLAARIGQELQVTKVAAETGVALQTAREWLSIAEASGVVTLLPPFHENIGKTVVKKPKLYFTDTGFAAWLCDLPSPEALHRYCSAGAFFENFVIIELMKSWLHNGRRPSFFFYRDSQQREIDLLIKTGNTYHPVEIKTTSHPEASMVKAFDCIRSNTFRRGRGALVCLTDEMRFLTADVVALSILDI